MLKFKYIKQKYLKNKKFFNRIIVIVSMIILLLSISYFNKNSTNKNLENPNIEKINSEANNSNILPPFSIFYDFENIQSADNIKSLYTEKAFSGKTSTKAFGKNSFSVIIEKKVKEIGIDKLSKISMSGKIYIFPLHSTLNSALVLTISSNNGETKYWKGIEINGFDNLPIETWLNVSGDFILKDIQLSNEDVIKFYLWNSSNNDMLLDDLFIIFGEEPERPGNKTICDLTSNAVFYKGPPYPVFSLFKNNLNDTFTLNNNKDLFNNDSAIIKGYFIEKNSGLQSIICFGKSPTLYHYCSTKRKFLDFNINMPDNKQFNNNNNFKIYSSDFDGDGFDEILFLNKTNQSLFITKIEKKGNINQNTLKLNLTYWYEYQNNINSLHNQNFELYCYDFNNDNKSEILLTYENGIWELYGFINKKLYLLSTGNLDYFNKKIYNINIFCDKINTQQNILIYGNKKSNNSTVLAIYSYSPEHKTFINNNKHIYYNCYDTINKNNIIYSVNFGNGNSLLKYNFDKYFDLKLMNYIQDTFQILYNIDFKGYNSYNNPKYYEKLNLITGNFISNRYTSIITIAGCYSDNKKNIIDKPGFPTKIEIYSPTIK